MIDPTKHPAGFDGWLRRHITQATIAVSLVVGISGVLLFFNLAKVQVHALHEWLGMLFVLIAVLHVVRHRAIFASMLRQPRQYVLLGLAGATMLAFVVASGGREGGNPIHGLADRAFAAPLTQLAPVVGLETEEAQRRLAAGGIVVDDPASQSLKSLAATSHTDPRRLLALLLGK